MREASLLDEEDLRVVHALQLAPRASWTSLAPILGAHSTTLAARWKRLADAGLAWVAAHSVDTQLCPVSAFVEVLCDAARREQVIAALTAQPDVVSLDISARHRDLLLIVSATSITHLTDHVLPRISGVAGVEHLETSICTGMHVAGDSWTVQALRPDEVRRVARLHPRTPADTPVPRVRLEVLDELARDGRIPAAEVARRLGMSEPTVRRQIRAAIAHGLINLRCELAQEASGTPITAQWFATVPASDHGALAARAAELPGVRLCASTTGRTNILLTFWLRAITDVPRIELLLAQSVPAIVFRESAIALRIVKRVGWLLGTGGRATGHVVAPSWGRVAAEPVEAAEPVVAAEFTAAAELAGPAMDAGATGGRGGAADRGVPSPTADA